MIKAVNSVSFETKTGIQAVKFAAEFQYSRLQLSPPLGGNGLECRLPATGAICLSLRRRASGDPPTGRHEDT